MQLDNLLRIGLASLGLLALSACNMGPKEYRPTEAPPAPHDPPPAARATRPPAPPAPGHGQSIVVCGERFPIDAPVVLWTDAGGYDAYSLELRFPDEAAGEAPVGLRYAPGRVARADGGGAVPPRAGRASLDAVRERVDQFVLHYDVAGTSRQCFKVLHDRRKLSVHFLLDLDGTLYQTLDLADTAWHASQSNPRSIGIEIASIGAYAPGPSPLDAWYTSDEQGPRVRLPERLGDGGVRTPGFVARPARPERLRGVIQGQELEMHDFTAEQHRTLARLTAALTAVFPKLQADAPRSGGRVVKGVLDTRRWETFQGILGHYHVSAVKVDPGPALDWEPFLAEVRALRAASVPKP